MRVNKLENCIINGVPKIQRLYNKVSDGWWLYHAPESFIQSHLALHIAHNGEFCVYPECSPKRWKASVSRGNGTKPRGRPFSAHNKKRFDLVIWRKSGKRPRAIVEIKRAVYASPLVEDAGKIVEAPQFGKKHRELPSLSSFSSDAHHLLLLGARRVRRSTALCGWGSDSVQGEAEVAKVRPGLDPPHCLPCARLESHTERV